MIPKKKESSIKAYMGEYTVFKGALSFEGTVRIDGKFEGQVHTTDTLIIGETGDIAADIEAGMVICKGKIKGTIIAAQKIEMHASSKIMGNVQTPVLNIEPGAVLDGNCDMSGKEGKKIIKLIKEDGKEKGASA